MVPFRLPGKVAESADDLVLFLQIFLHLLSHVKDCTVLVGANDVLVQTALAPLTLCPQASELLLESAHGADLLLIELGLLGLTVAAHGSLALLVRQDGLAAQTGLALLGEHGNTAGLRDDLCLGQRVLAL